MHLSGVSQVCSNQVCMMYFHRIMSMSFLVITEHAYLQYITICYYVISHFQHHAFTSNFVYLYLECTPTKFGEIEVLPLCFMELWVFLCKFWSIH